MDRRSFISKSLQTSLLLSCSQLSLSETLLPLKSSTIYFGYGSTGIGSNIGRKLTSTLETAEDHLHSYTFVSNPGKKTLTATGMILNSNENDRNLLMVTSSVMTVFPSLFKNLPYDPVIDFKPIAFFGYNAYALVIGPVVDQNVKTLDDYIEWVRNNPEYRDLGSSYYGSESHLASIILAREKKIALRSVIYGGTSVMIEDLYKQELAACILIGGNGQKLIDEGVLRVLAVCSAERHPPWPEIPTMKEFGIKDMDLRGWYAIVGSKQMKQSLFDHYIQVFQKAQKNTDFTSVLQSLSLDVSEMDHLDMAAKIEADIVNYRRLIVKNKLTRVDLI